MSDVVLVLPSILKNIQEINLILENKIEEMRFLRIQFLRRKKHSLWLKPSGEYFVIGENSTKIAITGGRWSMDPYSL
jgi:hypothetical protein